jgi:hypothetical protein
VGDWVVEIEVESNVVLVVVVILHKQISVERMQLIGGLRDDSYSRRIRCDNDGGSNSGMNRRRHSGGSTDHWSLGVIPKHSFLLITDKGPRATIVIESHIRMRVGPL